MAGKLTLSVSQLNEYIRRTLQMDPMLHGIELRGEISNLKFHQTGTLFFTLKDESAAISCVMYASDVQRLGVAPFDGMRAVVSGSVGLYVRGGQMQFYASGLRAEGIGVLYERLTALREKLSAEGLFDPSRKRAISLWPDTIGVVSSPTGAVIHDIMNVSLRRDPQARILLCPVRVQGIGSADEVVAAIQMLESMEQVSVIIVARGGGSIEDLWTFNEERVVRAVADCRKPVISAVGHETDVTLCDLAADLRAPTPSAAAECAVPVRAEWTARMEAARSQLCSAMMAQIEKKEASLRLASARLAQYSPTGRLVLSEQRLAACRARMRDAVRAALEARSVRLDARVRELMLLSPYRVLSRGYAMVMHHGLPVKSTAQLSPGDRVTLRFADGQVDAVVGATEQEELA